MYLLGLYVHHFFALLQRETTLSDHLFAVYSYREEFASGACHFQQCAGKHPKSKYLYPNLPFHQHSHPQKTPLPPTQPPSIYLKFCKQCNKAFETRQNIPVSDRESFGRVLLKIKYLIENTEIDVHDLCLNIYTPFPPTWMSPHPAP